MKLKILYEDENIMVIDKPAGVLVHSDGRSNIETIADWVLEKYPETKEVGEPFEFEKKGGEKIKIYRPGIVHRLDKETTGALIVAKNQKIYLFLKDQFKNHTIKKIYRAFVYGFVTDPKASLITNKRGVIDAPIGRSSTDIRMWTAGRGARSKLRDAITEYIVLNRFSDNKKNTLNQEGRYSYVELYPKTGRTHQIRVHMKYINHPVVSDPLYRGKNKLALGMDRLALHAFSITFKLPSGELKTVEAPFPSDFKKVVDKYIN